MSGKRKFDEQDDGRTIANMDNLGHRGLFASWFGAISPEVREDVFGRRGTGSDGREQGGMGGEGRRTNNPNMSYAEELSPEDRRALIRYTLKYALAIGTVFVVAFGILIAILTNIW